jgi:hypothetical protein
MPIEWKAYDQLSDDRDDSEITTAMERGFRSDGWKGALRENIEALKAQSKTKPSTAYGSAYRIAEAYAQLADKDQAFQWFNTAFQEHDEGLVALKTDFHSIPPAPTHGFPNLFGRWGCRNQHSEIAATKTEKGVNEFEKDLFGFSYS